ncbi:class I SAM-dependent methyltransferase [Chlorobaculum thiosulfatiphilum]|uniref:Class I SAM-dependent methyltransferase n=1 Tax=Chlorobaculum thiosulfatiphilum TaxID=115852 RepID=A0A5C4S0P3_CHLTI|nr:class I SAM-dependent methyltransferase [Chlorobaculum thiosulfatiphilum]TNJ36788.1 class I SAM-dependent methyltransferase [Chlorobaculum thiosulfatiphilum]
MKTVPCPITGSREFLPLMQAPDRFDLRGPSWRLVRSTASGLVMLNPRPEVDEMAAHYPAETYDPFLHAGNARTLRDRTWLAVTSLLLGGKAKIVMKGLEKPAKSVRILEVGCSTGRLLMRIHRDYGIPLTNLFGVETDRQAADTARNAGLCVSEAGLEESDFDIRFDRIVFWHTLEHLHRLGESLDCARELLTPDGQLIIAVPNLDSDDARRYGPNWIALDAPRHLYHFTPETLGKLLEKHGFSVLDLGTWIPDTLYNVWFSEKLDRTINGRPLGIGAASRAASNAIRSLASGRDPRLASSMVVRAVRMKG